MTSYTHTVEQFLLGLWNDKSLKNNCDLYSPFSPSLIINSPIGKKVGTSDFITINNEWNYAFPDLQLSNIEVESFGDAVITTWRSRARQQAPFKGLEPSGKKIDYFGETIFFFKEGKIVRYSCKIDMVHLYHQLGMWFTPEEYDQQRILSQNKDLLIERIRDSLSGNLTKREVEMLSLYITGFNAKQIGSICFISSRTVETHLFRALHELGCTNKYQCLEKLLASYMLPLIQDLAKLLLKKGI